MEKTRASVTPALRSFLGYQRTEISALYSILMPLHLLKSRYWFWRSEEPVDGEFTILFLQISPHAYQVEKKPSLPPFEALPPS